MKWFQRLHGQDFVTCVVNHLGHKRGVERVLMHAAILRILQTLLFESFHVN